MNIKQLYYFVVIAEAGNITAAARKLQISQPPLSKQMIQLEDELGVKLMERGSRRITLTDAGYVLYNRAKDIVAMMDITMEELNNLGNGLSGTLKLGTISSSGNVLLDGRLVDFCTKYPHVNFEVYEGNTYELLEKLKNGLIEAAVVRTPFNSEGLECVYIGEEPLAAVGYPKYLDKLEGKHITIASLVGKPLIYYRRFEHIISQAFQSKGLQPTVFCRNDDARTSLLWAKAGLGVALVPESISGIFGCSGMVERIIDCKETVTRIAAIRKKDGYVSNIAKKFVESFKQERMQLGEIK